MIHHPEFLPGALTNVITDQKKLINITGKMKK